MVPKAVLIVAAIISAAKREKSSSLLCDLCCFVVLDTPLVLRFPAQKRHISEKYAAKIHYFYDIRKFYLKNQSVYL